MQGRVPMRTVQQDLKRLVDADLLKRIGNARSSEYDVSESTRNELLELQRIREDERVAFAKFRGSGIASRFTIPNMYVATSWLIRRKMAACGHPDRRAEHWFRRNKLPELRWRRPPEEGI